MEFLGMFALNWAWFGRLSETESQLKEAINIALKLEFPNDIGFSRDLGFVLGMQGKYEEAKKYFGQSVISSKNIALKSMTWQGIMDGILEGFHGGVVLGFKLLLVS